MHLFFSICIFMLISTVPRTNAITSQYVGAQLGTNTLGKTANQALYGSASRAVGAAGQQTIGRATTAAVGQQAAAAGTRSEAAQVQGVNTYQGRAAENAASFGGNGYARNVGQYTGAAQLACQTFVCVEWFDAQGLSIEKTHNVVRQTNLQSAEGLAGYNQAALAGYGQRGLYNVGQARYAYQPYAAAYGVNRGYGAALGSAANYGAGYGANAAANAGQAVGYRGAGAAGTGYSVFPSPAPGYAPFVGGYGPGVGYGFGNNGNYGGAGGLNSIYGSELAGQQGAGYGANYGTGIEAAKAYNAAGVSSLAAANAINGQAAEAAEGTRAGSVKTAATNIAASALSDRLAAFNTQGYRNVGKKCMRYQCFQNMAAADYRSLGPNYFSQYGAGVGRAALQGAASGYGAGATQYGAGQGTQAAYQSGPYTTGYGSGVGTEYGQGSGTGYGSGYGAGYGNGYNANYGASYPGYGYGSGYGGGYGYY